MAYPRGKEEAVVAHTRPFVRRPFPPFHPTSLSVPFSSPDGELFFLVCALLRSYGLHDLARSAWEQRRVVGGPNGEEASDDLPQLPIPSIPDDALRLLVQSLLQSKTAADHSPRLPPSLFHCGSQALLPHFRAHPLRPIVQARFSSSASSSPSSLDQSSPTFPYLRARSFLPSPSSPHPPLHSLRAASTIALTSHYRVLKFLFGHLAPVYSVIFDSSGDLCATGSDDKLVKVWSARSGRLLLTLRGHEKEVTDIAISPDNALLASASWDHSIRVWALRKGGEPYAIFFHHHHNKIWRISFHPHFTPSHRLLFSASMDGSTQIFDLNRPEQSSITLFAHPQHLSMPDHLAALTEEEAVKGGYRKWLTPQLTHVNQGGANATGGVRALPQGVAEVAAGPAAPVMAAADGARVNGALSLCPEMLCISHHPSGDEFALGSNDRCIRVYSMRDKQLTATLKGAQGEIDQLHYDHSGESDAKTTPAASPPRLGVADPLLSHCCCLLCTAAVQSPAERGRYR